MKADLHDEIMRIKCDVRNSTLKGASAELAYKQGHRDARHAAAELALAASGGNAAPELPEPLEINWPTLNSNALGCGVEDRGLRDRYECAAYGWEDGVDRAIECVPEAIYDADQMREYGKACAAASAPNAALVAALQDILMAHANDNIRPKAFYIATDALSAVGQEVK